MWIERKQWRVMVVFGVLIVGMAFGLVWPTIRQTRDFHDRIAKAEKELDNVTNQTNEIEALTGQVKQLQQQVDANKKIIPNTDAMASLLRDLSVQIEDAKLNGQGMSTLPGKKSADYLVMPVEMSFRGNGLSAFQFVQQIEQMPQMIQVDEIWMKMNPDTPGEVRTILRLNTYFTLAEANQR